MGTEMNFTEMTKQNFNALADHLFSRLKAGEQANLNLSAEETLFVRFNASKIRQNTYVSQRKISLILQKDGKTAHFSFSITGQNSEDIAKADFWLEHARKECQQLPEDPYLVPLTNNGTSDKTLKGHLPTAEELIQSVTKAASDVDLAGLYCGGPLISANRNSQGQSHWFANENFFLDYSLYLGQKAVKSIYAGTEWNQAAFLQNLAQSKNNLSLMDRPQKTVPPGSYKVYLAPGAVAEITSMLSWGALSYAAFKQGTSGLQKLGQKEKKLSSLFSVRENFGMGLNHRYNDLGEVAPEILDLISEGELKNFLVNSRSAKEYSVPGNAADSSYESPRALEILPGTLQEKDILKELGTGLYLSNLHYINWSDRMGARITGMTRYACFWVENGEIAAPIADLRFDESLYDCFGENLLAVTNFQEIDPMTSTYSARSFGGKKVPGMLIKDFKFTL